MIQLGPPIVQGFTAKLLFRKGAASDQDDTAFGSIWYEANHLGPALVLESEGHLYFAAGSGGAPPIIVWRAGDKTSRTDIMPHDHPNQHNYASTVPLITWQHDGHSRISFNATGLAFNDKSPIAKPTVTSSRGGNLALHSLLSALEKLGLIRDATDP